MERLVCLTEVMGSNILEAYWSTHSNFGTNIEGHMAPSFWATWRLLNYAPQNLTNNEILHLSSYGHPTCQHVIGPYVYHKT